VRIERLFGLSLLAFLAGLLGVYWFNSANPAAPIVFRGFYYFAVGDALSYAGSLAFVFLFSLMFFGYSAPLALFLEGARYASLYTTGGMPLFDLAFAFPGLLACYSAVLLGKSALADFRGTGSVFTGWRTSFKLFLASALLLGALLLARGWF